MSDLNEAPYSEPTGPDPEDIPDPMPVELQRSDDQASEGEDGDPMEGPAPTG